MGTDTSSHTIDSHFEAMFQQSSSYRPLTNALYRVLLVDTPPLM